MLSSVVFADYLTYDADNDAKTSLQVAEIDGGFIYQPSENLFVRAGIGYADRQREDTDAAGVRETTQSDSGPSIRGDFRYNVEDDFVLRGNARYTTAAPDPQFSGNLVGTYRLPRGSLRGRIFQNYTATSSGGQQARVTGASLGLVRDLTTVSRLSLDFAVATQVDVDDLTATDEADINRVNVTAVYSHDITERVSADIGYRFRSRQQDPEDAQSNAVFFEIGRTFETGL